MRTKDIVTGDRVGVKATTANRYPTDCDLIQLADDLRRRLTTEQFLRLAELLSDEGWSATVRMAMLSAP